jgi:hypothetical protein
VGFKGVLVDPSVIDNGRKPRLEPPFTLLVQFRGRCNAVKCDEYAMCGGYGFHVPTDAVTHIRNDSRLVCIAIRGRVGKFNISNRIVNETVAV